MSGAMRRSRLSLFYLAGYLLFAGVLLMVAPRITLQLLLSNGQYGEVMPRLAGVVLFALGIFIVQIIRQHIHSLYKTAILVRLFILGALTALYFISSDLLFLVLFAVVAIGVVLTSSSYLLDRRKPVAA